MSSVQVLLLVSIAIWGATVGPATAFDHIVGGALGWNIPETKTYFEDWAKPRVFGVQDKLVFPFRSPLHNVIEVNKAEFEKCTQENPIDMFYHGPLIINFTQPGEHFYYSGIGTQCELGVKLHINVVPGKGSSGRKFNLAPIASPSQSPPSPHASSAAATTQVGLALVSLVSLVAWNLFL